jgi:hypothetical protein
MSIKALFRSIERQWFSGSSKENGNTFVQQGASVCSNCGLELLGGPDGVPAENREPCPECGERARTFGVLIGVKSDSLVTASGTSVHVLDSANKYYSEVLKPAYDEFLSRRQPSRQRLAWLLFCFITMNGYLNTIDRSLKLILERPYPPQVPFGEMSRAGIIALALFEMWQIHQNMCDSLAILLLP